jgi:hypothetical protein
VLRRANSEEEARKIFNQAEAALDTDKEAPAGADVRASRTIHMLGEEYLQDSRERGKQPRTMEGRESRLNAHINPTIGDVPVAKWRVEHSRKVMEKVGRANVLHGATVQYVDPRLRPETRQVKAMADAADLLCGPDGTDPLLTRLPLFGTKIRVAGFGGLRLGEQNALRAIDVFFEHGYVHVNGAWITPRKADGFRGPVKNHSLHEVPLPGSLLRDELLPRVKELLGLPTTATLQQVINAQDAERQRRASLAARQKDRSLAWWNYPVPPEDELWLFIDTVTGLPVKPEMHNERWHRVRVWVEANDAENAWPKTIVYRNLRHHAATKWFHDELSEPWEVVAQYLGDKLTTVLNHYVRAGEDALRDSANKLATL